MNKILLTTVALIATFTASLAADSGSMAKENTNAMAAKSAPGDKSHAQKTTKHAADKSAKSHSNTTTTK